MNAKGRLLACSLLALSFNAIADIDEQIEFEQLDFEQVNLSETDTQVARWLDEQGQPLTAAHLTNTAHQGKQALVLKSDGEKRNFSQTIDTSFVGESFSLSGFVRTQDIKQLAGMFIQQFDSRGNALGFEFLKGLTGTQDWQQYQVTAQLHQDTSSISIGGFIVGGGKAWFDDLTVAVDGKDYLLAKRYTPVLLAADTDNEFDKKSAIELIDLTASQIDNLSKLAKVWGLVKYYHNAVAAGGYNMDAELFRVMPKVLSAKTSTEANAQISHWLSQMSTVSTCKPNCVTRVKQASLQVDLNWIDDENDLGAKLSQQLRHMVDNRQFESHYYFDFNSSQGVEVNNERGYFTVEQDAGYRLLALFRLWSLIEYFSPYKALAETPWQDIPRKYISQFNAATSQEMYERALLMLLGELNDGHAYLNGSQGNQLPQVFGNRLAPIQLGFFEQKWVVTANLAPKSNPLSVGNVITHVDGQPVDKLVKKLWPLMAASNDVSRYDLLKSRILQTEQPQLALTLANDSEVVVPTVAMKEIYLSVMTPSPLPEHHIINEKTGYINMTQLVPEQVAPLMQQYGQLPQLIIDVRGYPRGAAWALAEHLFAQPKLVAKAQLTNMQTPGDFILEKVEVGKNNSEPYQGKIVLLSNEQSFSQAEFTLMILRQADNALVLGSQTAGTDGDVSRFVIPGGYQSQFSGIGILTPTNEPTQRVGVAIDVEVTTTVEAVKAGKDEQIEQALILLNSDKFDMLVLNKSARL
ncbi:S41 family peptidase [Shewanella waksmanii]|uniref:S41 family peptidase n=1 Tax=Shewanella waksmanii TaxID=213783 RepID=UPI0037353ED6